MRMALIEGIEDGNVSEWVAGRMGREEEGMEKERRYTPRLDKLVREQSMVFEKCVHNWNGIILNFEILWFWFHVSCRVRG